MAEGPNFLNVEDNSFDNSSLQFVRDELEDSVNHLLEVTSVGSTSPMPSLLLSRPYTLVQPQSGCCIKTFKLNSNEKFFINLCRSDEIPAPGDITEEQLKELLQSEEPSSYRISMSLAEPRTTKDNSNNDVEACDVAINPKFFDKLNQSRLFRDFFYALIAEAISDKYNIQISIDRMITLVHRKYIGTLVSHKLRTGPQTGAVGGNGGGGGASAAKSQLVQELDSGDALKSFKQNNFTKPEYKLRARVRNDIVEEIQAEFYLPKCVSSMEIILEVGEDRILLESLKHGYHFDEFLDYCLDPDGARGIFDKNNKILLLRVPVVPDSNKWTDAPDSVQH